ncbi:hypothetical protein MHC_02380 [Mycoplasma haemocanis str. Illinois]|uniref:Uncharacterized protein n=1 Tax=Mycoplasma haemocanis (strain Illinois) TaxID=1111676 RepID=H6N6R8_MYCHN|nr:hypothetical protein [Mycoplasma haemocanis]AEW45340.1 hypothetical protein MHC_02380 [Mycoplasma haemocanis str. Illinois]
MVSLSGSFWGGILLVGASVGIGSVLLPSQIIENLELTSTKTRSLEGSDSGKQEFSSEQKTTHNSDTPNSPEGKVEESARTNEGDSVSSEPNDESTKDTPVALPQASTQRTGCVIYKLISSKPWKFEKFGSGDSFLERKSKTAAYNRIKGACDKAKGGNILVKNKHQYWFTWEWDYDGKDPGESEFRKYLQSNSEK